MSRAVADKERIKEARDLGLTLVAATLLLFSVAYLAQCSSTSRSIPSEPGRRAVGPSVAPPAGEARENEAAGKRKSIRDIAAEEDKEESERIKNIGHALQTIAANPEARKTFGFPP